MRRMREQWFLYLLLSVPVVALYYGVKTYMDTAGRKTIAGKRLDADAVSGESAPTRDLTRDSSAPWVRPATEKSHCAIVEYPGDGLGGPKVSAANWQVFMQKYHGAKASLLKWLQAHRKEFSDQAYAKMVAMVRDLKVHRPPSWEEPDLAWRGIAVATLDGEG